MLPCGARRGFPSERPAQRLGWAGAGSPRERCPPRGLSGEPPAQALCPAPQQSPPAPHRVPFWGETPLFTTVGCNSHPVAAGRHFQAAARSCCGFIFFLLSLVVVGRYFRAFFFFLFPLLPPLLAPVTSPALSGAAELGAVPGLLSPGAACGGNGPFLPPQIGFPARQALTASSCSPLPIRAALTHFGGGHPRGKKAPSGAMRSVSGGAAIPHL